MLMREKNLTQSLLTGYIKNYSKGQYRTVLCKVFPIPAVLMYLIVYYLQF